VSHSGSPSSASCWASPASDPAELGHPLAGLPPYSGYPLVADLDQISFIDSVGLAVLAGLRYTRSQASSQDARARYHSVPGNEITGVAMDGSDHYRKAEELAAKAEESLGQGDGQDSAAVWATVAQVHATLALATAAETVRTRPDHRT
jgi:hypothetical protein